MIMNMAVMNFIPRCRRMLGDGTILNRVIVFSTIYGLFEGVSIFALLPAITSLVTGQPVLGLGVTGWIVVLACLAVLGGGGELFPAQPGLLRGHVLHSGCPRHDWQPGGHASARLVQ